MLVYFMKQINIARKSFIELISLSSPRSRLSFWLIATLIIYFLPYSFFKNLSIWGFMGWDNAPSIGLTRAYWLLIHGDIAGAFERNKLIFAVLIVGAPIIIIDLYKIIKSLKLYSNN